ncbi:MAG: uracil phosphoribosyltransferase [Bacteroidia bacterium]|nr:uracil phosphoribosyltransferase [Bacteroidia bacterium]NNF30829.1 uracil phosphoribosyltransferase [Flavobacteriaceae bacterium]MBT8275464.1 uracil phosphoribosyltransferase [Bacteroidia bacterium]NNJ82002.1 uracil phosphoribosyltransferase [Flavobacteriaceae bacterium]NNK54442.1 uracil phosphoribosyltransferase [Flavobacteriaceae bacterium]
MIIHNFEQPPSLLDQFISEIRDKTIQTDPMRFRKNIERIGEILSYEMSKTLDYKISSIETPFGIKEMPILQDQLVLCSVLRAGLPLHQGILNYFDRAENAFISAYRYHPEGGDDFEVIVRYFASPKLDNKVLVLTDPMLATGKTLENVFKTLRSHGNPKKIHILSVIGSEEGVQYVSKVFPESTEFWTAAIDKTLTAEGYIIPGLGDAGDLAFGEKL